MLESVLVWGGSHAQWGITTHRHCSRTTLTNDQLAIIHCGAYQSAIYLCTLRIYLKTGRCIMRQITHWLHTRSSMCCVICLIILSAMTYGDFQSHHEICARGLYITACPGKFGVPVCPCFDVTEIWWHFECGRMTHFPFSSHGGYSDLIFFQLWEECVVS